MKNIKWYIMIVELEDFQININNPNEEKINLYMEFMKRINEDNRFIKAGDRFIVEYKLIDEIIDDYENYGIEKDNFVDLAKYFFKEHYENFIKMGEWDVIEFITMEKELFKKLYWDIVHITLDKKDIIEIYNNKNNSSFADDGFMFPIFKAHEALVHICLDDLSDVDVVQETNKYNEDKMISEYIENHIASEEVSKKWVAEKCGIKYKTFIDKLNRGSFTAYEFIKIVDVLDIDYYKISNNILRKDDKQMLVLKCSLCGSDLTMMKDESSNEIIFFCKNPKCEASDEQEGCIEKISEENIKEI